MTEAQVLALVAYRSHAWGRTATAEETATWVRALAQDPEDFAVDAMRECQRADQWPPTVARFREVRRALERAADGHRPALPAAEPEPDAWRAGMAKAREALAATTTRPGGRA